MKLRGIDFGQVLDASGVRGFFGEGYPHHRWLKPVGLDFTGSTFVAKTTTWYAREGNMPLNEDLSPKERLPRCIVVKPLEGVVLNAVGLSGPGALALLRAGLWQQRTKPFFLSFMSVAKTAEERLNELHAFVELLKAEGDEIRAPWGLQINFSCPNAGLHPDELVDEISESLYIGNRLGVPLMPKCNHLLPPAVAVQLSQNPFFDALCIPNTVPWGTLPDKIDWKGIFGSEVSPLAHLGGGGLSGRPLLQLTEDWIKEARALGFRKPINAGGGIMCADDAIRLLRAGADSVFVGTAAIIRPWRVAGIIRTANDFVPAAATQAANTVH